MDDLVASSTLLGDRFELQREVARGGMGAVYRAQDRQTKEAVAVKLMTAERPEAAERFEREATLLATLHHPAIVRYVAHGVSDKGRPWLAMQWLDGTPLSARLKKGPLSLPECVSVTRRVASALETAHAAGIVHRDVKP
ncbi:MAG TPA: serine/threonine-protein kinase, partial [Polyangiaceae bacterium]|nr:serine/threonine-protein kinase [Polyangiaceae bacterium]